MRAWKYGPVIPTLYRSMKAYGSDPVTQLLPELGEGERDQISDQEVDLIGQVFRIYGRMTGIQLSALTHQNGTPWAMCWNPDIWNNPISNDLIAEHYRRLANERRSTGND